MACKIKSELVHFIYGEVSPEVNQDIKEHLISCSECREELELLTGTKEMLDNWENISPSEGFQKALNEKITVCEREELGDRENLKQAFLSMIKTLSPAICGILVTSFMILIMAGKVRFSELNPVSLMLCGVFWSGIYSMLFDLAIKNGSYGGKIRMRRLLGLNLKLSVYFTVLALIIGLMLMLVSPLSKNNLSYLEEFLYSFIPLFISSFFIGKRVCPNYLRHGIFLGIFYMLMIGPALYIQCLNCEITLYVLLIIISSFGAITGGIAGARMSSLVSYQTSKS